MRIIRAFILFFRVHLHKTLRERRRIWNISRKSRLTQGERVMKMMKKIEGRPKTSLDTTATISTPFIDAFSLISNVIFHYFFFCFRQILRWRVCVCLRIRVYVIENRINIARRAV